MNHSNYLPDLNMIEPITDDELTNRDYEGEHIQRIGKMIIKGEVPTPDDCYRMASKIGDWFDKVKYRPTSKQSELINGLDEFQLNRLTLNTYFQ